MNYITKEIIIDVAKKNQIPDVVAKNGDIASRFIIATIKNNGQAYSIDSQAEILLDILRPDGLRDAFVCELLENGKVKAPLTQWVLGCYGKVRASISIIKDNMRLTTTNFIIDVQECEFDDFPSGTEEYEIIVDVLSRLVDLEERVEELEGKHFTEIGETGQLVPSDDLSVSGIFFRKL